MADPLYENDDGIKASLNTKTGKASEPIGTGTLRLCTAPGSMSKTNVITDFTEATFPGYAGVVLSAATWATATVLANVASSLYGANVTFTRGVGAGSQSITGWFLTDSAKTKLYACAKFTSGPFVVSNPGDAVVVVPTLTDESKS